MAFDSIKKELGGQILAMPVHSTVYRFARALGATHAEALDVVRKHNLEPEHVKVEAQERMTRFLARTGGSRDAIARVVEAGGHAYAFAGKGAGLGCGGCGKPVDACRCAELEADAPGGAA